ncbi:MAG TPA: hypothetical protein PLQ93_03060 [Bacteroidia bacterium]|nr:hypothetical protein [Bacteroidia bacterium]
MGFGFGGLNITNPARPDRIFRNEYVDGYFNGTGGFQAMHVGRSSKADRADTQTQHYLKSERRIIVANDRATSHKNYLQEVHEYLKDQKT